MYSMAWPGGRPSLGQPRGAPEPAPTGRVDALAWQPTARETAPPSPGTRAAQRSAPAVSPALPAMTVRELIARLAALEDARRDRGADPGTDRCIRDVVAELRRR